MARKLIVEIVGDASSLEKAFKQADQGTTKFGKRFGTVAKGAGIAALGIGGGIAFGLKKAIDTANEHALALKQTQAVIKSTGGVANVTAKQITGLADAIEKQTGFDDVAVQKGENLLATFTKVRNEVGKGNDVFNQATETLVDMSVALGQDTKTSAIQLGKALNDPAKGVGRLQKIGVSFTESQKDMIKSLVASGHEMEAQKLILKELNTEFGGSAKAAGETLPGQLKILQARLDDVAQKIGEKLVPALTKVVTWVSDHWPQIEQVFQVTFAAIDRAWQQVLRPALTEFMKWARIVVAYIRLHWPQISATINRVAEDIRIIWKALGPTITKLTKIWTSAVGGYIKGIARVVKGVAQILDGILHGDWSLVWKGLKNVAIGEIKAIRAYLGGVVRSWGVIGRKIGGALKDGIVAGLRGLGNLIARIVLFPINKIIDAINAIKISAHKVNTHIPGVGTITTPAIDPIPNIGRVSLGGGGDIVIHNVVELDGQRVAANTTRHQARAQRRTAAQRTGRVAGLGPVVG